MKLFYLFFFIEINYGQTQRIQYRIECENIFIDAQGGPGRALEMNK